MTSSSALTPIGMSVTDKKPPSGGFLFMGLYIGAMIMYNIMTILMYTK